MELQAQSTRALQDELAETYEQRREHALLAAQCESDVALWRARCEDLQAQQQDTLREHDSAQHASHSTAQQLSMVRRELQTREEDGLRLQQAISNLEEERDVLRRQLEEGSRRSRAERSDLQRAITEKSEALARVEELKVLVSNLEGSLRAHSHKHSKLAAVIERGGEDAELWEAERVKLATALEDRDRRVRDQQEALQSLDRERDRLQEQLDLVEEAAVEQMQLRKHQEQQISGLKQVQEQAERRLQALSGELTSAQRHAQAADARLNAAQLEVQEYKRRLSQKSVEVGGAAEDLMLMTRENQALTSELVQVSAERDRLQQRLQQVLHASASTEHARRSVEAERADLLNTYRTVLQEKRKLEEDITSLRLVGLVDCMTSCLLYFNCLCICR